MNGTPWTAQAVREELPEVTVKVGAHQFEGLVRGRRNEQATVSIQAAPIPGFSSNKAYLAALAEYKSREATG